MRALIRGTEVIIEPFNTWVLNNLAFLTGTEKDKNGNPINGDGWTLIDNYEPPEDEYDEGN